MSYAVLILILLKMLAEFALALLNRRAVQRHATAPPAELGDLADAETYSKAVQYTLAKNRCGAPKIWYDHLVLLAFLFSGLLPWLQGRIAAGGGAWRQAAFVLAGLLLLEAFSLPWDWWQTFRLEARFGFNRSTQALWWADLAKSLAVQAVLLLPLLALILALAGWLGAGWWLVGFAVVAAFQVVLLVLYPRFIMPWFNKFSPLPEGALKDRLLALSRRTAFPVHDIKVMDSSRRSGHSNAFFTGFGRWRRIVLFDTLIEQLQPLEIEAVLAHEVGHSKRHHTTKLLILGLLGTLAGFALVAWLQGQDWIAREFGFQQGGLSVVLLLLLLAGGAFTFWLAPLQSGLSRRYEYQADRFAACEAGVEGGGGPLISALKRLNKENLGNLTPHPAVVFFHYSHPPMAERLAALRRCP